ncbi:diguanylate cyclase (plasmid) [Deinococcus psychrotolerans]|uniref:Diguanylate cyclase n=1 Tax=Deinococcus psychrotolerans TaxID=2489213 RepID=A0A3G8YKZ1_9DEIO|nr:HD domain-containing phosphohydrolase [Deinococcus psychrotolerans]AZI44957.1 diguanylate cyclase [Deinococcus psychrotolerans]
MIRPTQPLSPFGHAPENMTFEAQCRAFEDAVQALITAAPQQALSVASDYLRFTGGRGLAQARSHLLLGQVQLETRDLLAALQSLEQAATVFLEGRDSLGAAQAHNLAGKVCADLGGLDDAEKHLNAAIAQVEGSNDPAGQQLHATALNHLAGVYHARGQVEQALKASEAALELWISLGDVQAQARVLSNIGNIQTWQGQYDTAVLTLRRAYYLHQTAIENPRSEAFILSSLGRLHHLNDENALAIEVMIAARNAANRCGDELLKMRVDLNLGTFYLAADQLPEAATHLEQALEISRVNNYRLEEASVLDSLGSLRTKQGDLPEARSLHQTALEIALETGDEQGQLDAHLHLGQVQHALGKSVAAEANLGRSLELAEQQHAPKELAQAHLALADLFQGQGEWEQTAFHLRALRSTERDLFSQQRERQVRKFMVQFEVERARHETDVYRLRTEVEQDARLAAEQLVTERTSELARAQHEVVTRLAMAAEYRDDTTGEHTRRVGRSAARLAQALGWPEERAQVLGIAARLHDVGKIGIPDTILLKPGKLSQEEYSQMQTHTLIGARILSGGQSELLRLAEEIALTHHERWDGQGYPQRLSGEGIPLTGRIVAVADVFDALTQPRPYKRAWSAEEALREVQAQAGKHFDPQVVEVALQVLTEESSARHDPELSGEAKFMPGEDASHMLAVFEQLLVERSRELDVARREGEQVAQQMERMALTDSLTQLPNRRAFEADLEAKCGVQPPHGASMFVMSLDLGGLKLINDAQGHAAGDRLLTAFARCTAEAFAPLGGVYRLGGDEFAVIGTAPLHTPALLERLTGALDAVRAAGFEAASASCGVAWLPHDAQTSGDLLRISDRRMYQQKASRQRGTIN